MRCDRAQLMSGGGFTLIELLAVLVIMALISALTLGGLSGADDQSELSRTAARLQRLDQLARVQSRAGGEAVRITHSESERCALVETRDRGKLLVVYLPSSAELKIEIKGGDSSDSIAIDRAGRSADYSASLRVGQLHEHWEVAGLTGYIVSGGSHHE